VAPLLRCDLKSNCCNATHGCSWLTLHTAQKSFMGHCAHTNLCALPVDMALWQTAQLTSHTYGHVGVGVVVVVGVVVGADVQQPMCRYHRFVS
jgi:hypothetical protein